MLSADCDVSAIRDTYMSAILEASEVKSLASGDLDVVQSDGSAASLVLDGSGSIGESATGASLGERLGDSNRGQRAQEKECRDHDDR